MTTRQNNGGFVAAWLKWALVPLLAFLLAGWVTKKLVSAKRDAGANQFKQTMAASLKKLDAGDRAGAVAGLARAGQMASGDPAQQAGLIPKLMALGEYGLAAEAIERSLRAAPQERQTVQAYAGLGGFLLEHGDLANAKRILAGDLVARWPDASQTAYLQGKVALQGATGKDDLAAAANQFQKCVALDPGQVPARVQLGIAYRRLGELDKAEPLLREVLEKRPFDVVALYHLGEVLGEQGKTAEATRYLDEHQRVSRLQERQKHLEGQYMLQKYQPADLLELARIYEQLGEFAKAVSTLGVYTRLQPADTDAQRQLAKANLKVDDKERVRLATGRAEDLGSARGP